MALLAPTTNVTAIFSENVLENVLLNETSTLNYSLKLGVPVRFSLVVNFIILRHFRLRRSIYLLLVGGFFIECTFQATEMVLVLCLLHQIGPVSNIIGTRGRSFSSNISRAGVEKVLVGGLFMSFYLTFFLFWTAGSSLIHHF